MNLLSSSEASPAKGGLQRPSPPRDSRRARYAAKYDRAKRLAFEYFALHRYDEAFLVAQATASFAWLNHIGIWCDEDIERLLGSLGDGLRHGPPIQSTSPDPAGPKVLYVTTALEGFGGHAETLRLWLKLLSREARQSVITTSRPPAPAFLRKIRDAGCFVQAEGGSFSARVRSVVDHGLRVGPGFIFLFIDPDDVVAVSAASVLKAQLGARVIAYDHADYVFWLGKGLADLLVTFSPSRGCVCRTQRRYPGPIFVIPLTTDLASEVPAARSAQRSDSVTRSLSVANPWKLVPDGFWDYLETMKEILGRNPCHIHSLVTLPDRRIADRVRCWPEALRRRFIVHHDVTDLARYYRDADFLIETFPFCGGQVRIEAMAFGLPVVFIDNPRFPLALSHSGIDAIASSYPFIARSNRDVIRHAETLIRQPDNRQDCGHRLQRIFERSFSPEIVAQKLSDLLTDAVQAPSSQAIQETAAAGSLDEDYLAWADAGRDRTPSPLIAVLRHLRRTKTCPGRLLIDCLRNLTTEDWAWCLKRFGRHAERQATSASPDP